MGERKFQRECLRLCEEEKCNCQDESHWQCEPLRARNSHWKEHQAAKFTHIYNQLQPQHNFVPLYTQIFLSHVSQHNIHLPNCEVELLFRLIFSVYGDPEEKRDKHIGVTYILYRAKPTKKWEREPDSRPLEKKRSDIKTNNSPKSLRCQRMS